MGQFIDFDKKNKIFYNNLYLDDVKIVIKIPLITNNPLKDDIIIEKFDLTKYNYLTAFE